MDNDIDTLKALFSPKLQGNEIKENQFIFCEKGEKQSHTVTGLNKENTFILKLDAFQNKETFIFKGDKGEKQKVRLPAVIDRRQ